MRSPFIIVGILSGFLILPLLLPTKAFANPVETRGITLQISTAKPVLLNKDIHTASAAHIFYTKKPMGARDILADPYFSQVRALNFQSIGWAQGSQGLYYHVIVGDTKISGGKGEGHNINLKELEERGDTANHFFGITAYHFGIDFFNEYCAFLEKLSVPGEIMANIQCGSLEELFWQIDRTHARRVFYGLELPTKAHEFDFPTGKIYAAKVTPWIEAVKKKYPEVISVIDAAPVWQKRERMEAWNRDLQTMVGDEIRIYLWDGDLYASVKGTDVESRLNQCFNDVVPRWVEEFHQIFPDKKISVLQWGLKPGSEESEKRGGRSDTLFGCLHVAKMYQWMIAYNRTHNNLISHASFTNLLNLIVTRKEGKPPCHYYSVKLCGELFKGTPNVLESSITGTNGVDVVCCEENSHYTVLMINKQNRAIAVPNVAIDGILMAGKTFHQEAISGKDPKSNQIAQETNDVGTIGLKAYSVNIIRF